MATAKLDLADDTAPADGPAVVLAEVRTETERKLITQWARREHPGTEIVEVDDPGLGERLQVGDDPLVTPVRVTWLPPQRDTGRRASPVDLMLLANPRRPPAALQPLLARQGEERARVSAGAPAHALELQRRFRQEEGGGSRQAFAGFVRRQATIAVDRAERGIIGDRYKVPRLVAEQIAASAVFRAQVAELAADLDRPVADVLSDATSCLDELATVQSPLAIDAYRAFMRPLHARAWTVEADWAALERLREANKKHALVFLPSHRSYVDPLVLQDVLHQADFARNHLLGGDNMAFWPLGMLGKRAGLVFIRRSFGNDRIYRLAVKAFFGHLVAKRFNLEWYIEGGRTRTGKLRPPRFGLLHYLAAAIEEGRADDVLLVPTSIVYDRLQEVRAMTDEHAAPKRGEGMRWFVDYMRAQRSDNGTARVDVGEPFSLREALAEAGAGRAQLEKVAFRICDGINGVTPVTATSLVTLALLGVRDRALTLEEVGRVTAPLLDLLEARGTPGHLAELRRPAGLRAGLDALQEAGVVTRFDGGTESVWAVASGSHQVAAFYRNGALHHFLLRATVELALLHLASCGEVDDPIEAVWQDALRTRDLLKFEFFFSDKQRFRDELVAELARMAPDWRDRAMSRGGAADLLAASPMLVAHRALRSFLDAQLVVATQLATREPRQAVERDAFMTECLGVGEQWVLQGRLHGPEAVSRELFAAALKLAANRDLVDPGREEVRRAREAWVAEIRDVVARLQTIGELDRAALEEVLGSVA